MRENVTVKEIQEANNLKPAEANALVKIFEHLGLATKTGVRHNHTTGKGKRPSEYSVAATCTLTVSEDRVVSVDIPSSEVYKEPETADVVEDSTVENTEEA
jgi:hypothetical protein